MKVLLTHGYFISEDAVEQKIMRPYPPLGLLYVSAYLEQKSIEHEVFDSTFSEFEILCKYLQTHKPTFIGIYVNFLTRINILKIINFIKKDAVLNSTKIILGGPDVRHNMNDYLVRGADYLVIGEGELTFSELIDALEKKKETRNISGIAYLDDEDQIVFSGERTHIPDLENLPFPNRKKINIQAYLDVWKENHKQNSITINTQRGCPFTCKWCSHAVYGDTYRRRPVKSVIEEIKELTTQYNPDSFWFVDDVFTMNQKWLMEFQRELQANDIKINYECITRADRLNEKTLQTLKDTGCEMLWIGAESGSQKVIDLMDRRVNIIMVREMIKLSKKHGIKTGTFIMLGYPGETSKDIDETIHHIKESNPDIFTINTAYPIRGTKLYEDVKDKLIPLNSGFEIIDRDIDFKRTYKRKYYDFAIRKVYNEVYSYKYKLEGKNVLALKLKLKSIISSMGMLLFK